ncbi:unnamed protein product [Diamesa tonsa]
MIQNHKPQMLLWLIDYGFPLKTDPTQRLSTINNEFKTDLDIIKSGCIDVLPAKKFFDHAFNETKLIFSHEWSQIATDFMENFISNALYLSFQEYGSKENVQFGDLTANDKFDTTFSLKRMLIAQKFALPCPARNFVGNLQNVDLKPSNLTEREDQNVQNVPSVLTKTNELFDAPEFVKTCDEFNFEKIYSKMMKNSLNSKKTTESLEIEVQHEKPAINLQPKADNPFTIYLPAGGSVHDYLKEDAMKRKQNISQSPRKTPSTTDIPHKEVKPTMPEAIKLPQSIPTTSKNTIEQQPVIVKQQKSSSIQKVEKNLKNVNTANLDKAIVCASDVHRVLVHGNFLSKPIDKIDECNFSDTIYNSMKSMNFRVFRIQAYSWRHILDGRSLVIVNSEKTGQTFSYLPAILNTVSDDCEDTEPHEPLCGPACIIIVPSSREVENLYNTSKKLLTLKSSVKIVKAFGNNDENTVVQLLNGCDIFITTPPCFSQLNTNSYVNLFDVKRIKYLIFDGLDLMLKLWQTDVQLIIKNCTRGTKRPEENPQIIVTSNVWHSQIKKFMSLSCQPVVCIGNYIEAAVYAGSKFSLEKCVTEEEKALKLCSRLKDESYKYHRTMVIVNNQAEIVQLVKYLQSFSFIYSIVDGSSTRDDIASKNISWGCEATGKFSLIIVIDNVVPQITLNSVQYLYHFSLPSTWTMFSYRFTVSYDYYLKYLESTDESSDLVPRTTILLDDDNLNEIPRLIEFMLAHRLAEIPKNILELVEKICHERERIKRDCKSGSFVTLCPNIFQFGECSKQVSCSYRHVFTLEDEAIPHLPNTGQIKFQLVDTVNPSSYKIKILEHLPDNSNSWISRKKELEYGEECMKLMQTYYAAKENQIMKHPVKVDDFCAVFDNQDVAWYRCVVTEKKQERVNYFFARVLLVDIGRSINAKSTDLMLLPAKFLQFAPQVSDLQVHSLIPNDFEDYWQQEITKDLKTKLARQEMNSYCVCRVEMAIRNTLFTDNFEIKIELPGVGIDLSNYDLKKDLIKRKLCSTDQSIVIKLKKLATNCGLVVPVTQRVIPPPELPKIIPVEPKMNEQWKQLHWKTDYEVILKDFNNPEDFFVILGDPKKKVQEISVYEAKDSLNNVVIGAICLVKEDSDYMKRVKVIKLIDDGSLVECFQLDFGETSSYQKDQLYEIPAHLVEFLPFQAINCRLIGICPVYKMDTWTKSAINAIYKTLIDGGEILKMHVIKNNEKHLKNKLLQINSYDVMLFDSKTGQRFDELLINLKYAVPDKDVTKLVIEDVREEDWSSEDEVEDVEQSETINSEVEPKPESINFLDILNLDIDDIDCQIDESEIMDMLGLPGAKVVLKDDGKNLYPLEELKTIETSTEKPKEMKKVEVVEAKESTVESVETPQDFQILPALSCSFKHPKIEWRQTNVLVYLKISAVDCKEYSLKISPESMSIIIKYEDTLESAIVHFFGCIDASLSSHELRGLNITVRLAKKITGKSWPRLTQHPDKNHAIKYCTEEINLMTEEKLISGITTKCMYRPTDSDYEDYSSDSSHDDNEFSDKLLEEPL